MNRCAFVTAVEMCLATGAMAGRPLVTDDADPVEPPCVELEAGGIWERVSADSAWHLPWTLAVGVAPCLEFAAGACSTYLERPDSPDEARSKNFSWLVDPFLQFKWQVVQAPWLNLRGSVVPTWTLPSPEHEDGFGTAQPSWDILFILSGNLSDEVGIHLNLGRTWVTDVEPDFLHWGIALDISVTEQIQLVAEAFGSQNIPDGGQSAHAAVGLRYALHDAVVLDFAVGASLTRNEPDWFSTAGFTWSFQPW